MATHTQIPSPPKLSIVTPSFNQCGYLQQCLTTMRTLEPAVQHIVADGASTDGSVQLLEAFTKSTPHTTFHSAQDSGMYEALNSGFSKATGNYFGYINCDDALLPWAPGIIIETFDNHPDVEMIIGDVIELTGNRVALGIQPPVGLLDTCLQSGTLLAQPGVFFRKSLYEKLGGFDSSFKLLGDQDFFARAIKKSTKIRRIWELLAIQRVVPDQLMATFASTAQEEKSGILKKYEGAPPSYLRKTLSQLLTPFLHRVAIINLGLTPFPLGAWQQGKASDFFRRESLAQCLKALIQSTQGKTYMSLTSKGSYLKLASELLNEESQA